MTKFLRRLFCLPVPTTKGDKKKSTLILQQQFDCEDIQAVHQSGPSRIVLCKEQKLYVDCDEFERYDDVYWFRGKFGNRVVTIKRKPKAKSWELVREVNLLEKIDHHESVMG